MNGSRLKSQNLKGSLILMITALIWGSAFVAQTEGSKHIGAFTFNAARSYIGAAFLAIILIFRNKSNKQNRHEEAARSMPIKPGIICGIALFFAMSCQQLGIGLYPEDAAASGRAGFVTATYVVLVALCEQLRGRKLHGLNILSVVGTIIGMYFLCVSDGIKSIYIGDAVVFLCSICFTIHILVIDKYRTVDSIKLSMVQFLTAAVISTVVSVIAENVVAEDLLAALVPVLYAGIFSSGIAYTLQMVGQKYAEPAVAAVVMSLESVFAVITGWLVLQEIMSHREMLGCVMVFISVIIAQIPQFKK